MAVQQVVAPPAMASIFLVVCIDEGGEDATRGLLGALPGLTRSVGFRTPADGLDAVVGIGSALWDRLFPELPKPRGLHAFREIRGERHTAVATPGDLLIHLRGNRMDICFELAMVITEALAGAGRVVDEVHGFKFYDQRDLLGFVDGTENPEGAKAADAVLVGDEDESYRGGSYVLVQKYLHDMAAWNALSTEEQERVIGRSKLRDIEMSDEVKPPNSHVALNVITDEEGNQLQILRQNMPFGRLGEAEFGTYFIGYAKDPSTIEKMLRNMFIGNPVGTTDRILDFSTAVTGSLYFVPTEDFLDSLGE